MVEYQFQALWLYEMAEKYGFLYESFDNTDLIKECIKSSLRQNYFLHFAGKWEGQMYKIPDIVDESFVNEIQAFHNYLSIPVAESPRPYLSWYMIEAL